LPVGAGGYQQLVGTDDVGLDELGRTVDGAIDMGFGGQVHDGVWLELQQRFAYPLTIGDAGLQELIARIAIHFRQGVEVAGVGELAQVEHAVPGVAKAMAEQGRAADPGPAGDENAHDDWLPWRAAERQALSMSAG